MPRDPLRSASRLRLLPDPDLRAQHVGRHPVVGVLLDQRRRQSGARLYRPAHRSDDHHSVDGRQLFDAARVLHQSDRRLDVDVSALRVRRAARVRRRQRARTSSRTSHSTLDTAATVRRTGSTPSASADTAQGPREPM